MMFGRVARRMALKNMTAQLRFPKVHLNKPHDFCKNLRWTDKTKVDLFGYNAQHISRKTLGTTKLSTTFVED